MNTSTNNLIFIVAIVIICLIIAVFGFGIIEIKPSNKISCSSNEERIIKTVESLQDYYKRTQKFPAAFTNIDELNQEEKQLINSIEKHDIDYFSFEDPNEAYIYFQDNCKLQITPNDFNLFPK